VLELCLSELNAAVNEIQCETATIAADIQRKNRDMNERVEHYKEMMSDSLSAKLTEFEKSFLVVKGSKRADQK
jgi:D-ribose pyranose/furanose isomerase RbsD